MNQTENQFIEIGNYYNISFSITNSYFTHIIFQSYLEDENNARPFQLCGPFQQVPIQPAPAQLPSPIPSPVSCTRISSPVSFGRNPSPFQIFQHFVPQTQLPQQRQCPSFNAILTYTPVAAPAPLQPAPFQYSYPSMICNCYPIQQQVQQVQQIPEVQQFQQVQQAQHVQQVPQVQHNPFSYFSRYLY
jgi:hypothetical protein